MNYAIILKSYTDGVGEVTHYFADPGFVSTHLDNPPHKKFYGRILELPNFERHLFTPMRITGNSTASYGYIRIQNIDGKYDNQFDAVDGRQFWIYRKNASGGIFPDDWDLVLKGTLRSVEFEYEAVRFFIRDRQTEIADIPINETTFLGSTLFEGGENLKDRIKPLVFGKVFNITPHYVDFSNHVFQPGMSTSQEVSTENVYIQGASVSRGNIVETKASLEVESVTAGYFDWYNSEDNDGGYFKLSTDPDHAPTCDVNEGDNSNERTTAQIIKRIFKEFAGLNDSDLDLESFSELDADAPYTIGTFIRNEKTIGRVLDELCSFGVWWLPKRDGTFEVGILKEPEGDPVANIHDSIIIGSVRKVPATDTEYGIPPWRVYCQYKRNWTILGSPDIAGVVSENTNRAQFLKDRYRQVKYDDEARKDRNPLSEPFTLTTLLTEETDAQIEAERWFTLLKPGRIILEVYVNLENFNSIVDLNDVVKITHKRFGLSDGKKMRIIGYAEDLNDDTIELILWG